MLKRTSLYQSLISPQDQGLLLVLYGTMCTGTPSQCGFTLSSSQVTHLAPKGALTQPYEADMRELISATCINNMVLSLIS